MWVSTQYSQLKEMSFIPQVAYDSYETIYI